jgi:hypothetical protein
MVLVMNDVTSFLRPKPNIYLPRKKERAGSSKKLQFLRLFLLEFVKYKTGKSVNKRQLKLYQKTI